MTTSAHIITAVIGSGVLSLAWATAQLGWIAGPVALVAFSVITWFTSLLLADCYRAPDGSRNYTYMDAVRSHLGKSLKNIYIIAKLRIVLFSFPITHRVMLNVFILITC